VGFRGLGNTTIGEVEAFTRKVLPVFFALVFLSTAAGAVIGYLDFNNWTIGDWLINYQAGFVRRGFLGELVFRLSLFSGINAGLVAVAFQLFFYGVFLLFSFLILKGRKVLFPFILLVFSPFIFMFQVCDTQGGYRKEIIYFALLSLLVWASLNLKQKSFTSVFLGIMAVFPMAVLSHEMLFFFLPYILAAYFQREKQVSLNAIVIFSLASLSLLGFFFCVLNTGTPDQVLGIQASLASAKYPLEGGAIAALAGTARRALRHVGVMIARHHYLFYLLPLLLSFLAFIPVFRLKGKAHTSRLASGLVLASVLGSLSLFAVAVDWGRFIYIHLVSIFLLLLSLDPECEDLSRWRDCRVVDAFRGYRLKTPSSVFAFLFWYLLLWHIPHYGAPMPYPKQLNLLELVKPFLELAGRI
jgi:hypothetical protein